jgi:hypothetical protein
VRDMKKANDQRKLDRSLPPLGIICCKVNSLSFTICGVISLIICVKLVSLLSLSAKLPPLVLFYFILFYFILFHLFIEWVGECPSCVYH